MNCVQQYDRRTHSLELGFNDSLIETPDFSTLSTDPTHDVSVSEPSDGFETVT